VYKVLKISDNNRKTTIAWLKKDVLKNAFAIYDLQYEQSFTDMYLALDEKGLIDGYMLVYTRLKYPSVILEGHPETAKVLLEKLQTKQMIMPDIPQGYIQIVKEKFPNAKFYLENWMLISRNQLRSIESHYCVRRLNVSDAYQLAILRDKTSKQDVATYAETIRKLAVYGIFINEKLVSSAQALVQLPEVWIVGGVYTQPEYRNKGFATQVVYALTKEALRKAKSASLFVRSNNYPALRVYTKIGYKKIGERVWVDVGTGIKP